MLQLWTVVVHCDMVLISAHYFSYDITIMIFFNKIDCAKKQLCIIFIFGVQNGWQPNLIVCSPSIELEYNDPGMVGFLCSPLVDKSRNWIFQPPATSHLLISWQNKGFVCLFVLRIHPHVSWWPGATKRPEHQQPWYWSNSPEAYAIKKFPC